MNCAGCSAPAVGAFRVAGLGTPHPFDRPEGGLTMRTAITILLLLALTSCASVPGQGTSDQATAATTAGGYNVGGEQTSAGGTYLGIGGDVTYNITVSSTADLSPEERQAIFAAIATFSEAIAAAPDTDSKAKLMDKLVAYAEKVAKTFGVSISIEGDDKGGDASPAGSTGSGKPVPGKLEPDPMKLVD